jgi:hypothetical protein
MVATTDTRRPAFPKPAFLSTEFNGFLFASIGADATGTYLTVISALARLDLDPWTEAASLARMPGSLATQKLAELVSRFPEIPRVRVDSANIAARLTALLPASARSRIPVPGFAVQALPPAARILMAPRFLFLLMSLTLGVVLATQLIPAPVHQEDPVKGAGQTVAHLHSPIDLSPSGSQPHKAGH